MPETTPFEDHAPRYDAWFDRHPAAYLSELLALRAFVPWSGHGLEIGVGSGRFAGPLGIAVGVDPSPAMLALAAARGIECVEGVAEDLPFADATFDHALIVTTICFVQDPRAMLSETHRVLKLLGVVVIGFIDRESPLGRRYLADRDESVFYRQAKFYSSSEVEALLGQSGFDRSEWIGTLSRDPQKMNDIEPVAEGTGRGAFVVVRAEKTLRKKYFSRP